MKQYQGTILTYKCGHTETVTLVVKASDKAWYIKNRLLESCYRCRGL